MRISNGIVAALITAFFFVHAALGAAWLRAPFPDALSFLVWIGVAAGIAHIALSIVTSYQMMTDTVRPPSSRKKRHLVLKWATGGALLALAIVHGLGLFTLTVEVLLAIVLAIALAVHACVGAKSLLKDLHLDRKYRLAFRVVVCAATAAICIPLLPLLF